MSGARKSHPRCGGSPPDVVEAAALVMRMGFCISLVSDAALACRYERVIIGILAFTNAPVMFPPLSALA